MKQLLKGIKNQKKIRKYITSSEFATGYIYLLEFGILIKLHSSFIGV